MKIWQSKKKKIEREEKRTREKNQELQETIVKLSEELKSTQEVSLKQVAKIRKKLEKAQAKMDELQTKNREAQKKQKKKSFEEKLRDLASGKIEARPTSTGTTSKYGIRCEQTLPYFNGRPESNVREWLHACKITFNLANCGEDERVPLASNYLKELALQDYLVFERINGTPNWKDFEKYILEKHTPEDHTQIIREQIISMKLLGSIKDYYVDFRRLTLQAPEIKESETLSLFIKNMKPKIQNHVRLTGAKDLEQAYEQAFKIRDIHQKCVRRRIKQSLHKCKASTSTQAKQQQAGLKKRNLLQM